MVLLIRVGVQERGVGGREEDAFGHACDDFAMWEQEGMRPNRKMWDWIRREIRDESLVILC